MNINLHIERVVLNGVSVPDHQRPLFQSAVESELARLVAADGLPAALLARGAMPSLPAATIQVNGGNDPTNLGQQIAQAVYGGISK